MNNIKKTLAKMCDGEVVILDYQEETEKVMCDVKDCYNKVVWVVCAKSCVEGDIIREVCHKHMPEVARTFLSNVREELTQ